MPAAFSSVTSLLESACSEIQTNNINFWANSSLEQLAIPRELDKSMNQMKTVFICEHFIPIFPITISEKFTYIYMYLN